MKKQMLKIAGVKSEKEFYKKFPTEKDFMAKHGKAFKKAQIGSYIGGESDAGFQPVNFQEMYDAVDYGVTGSTDQMRKDEQLRQAQIKAAQEESGKGGGGGLGNIANVLQSEELMTALSSAAGAARKGKKIKKAQPGEVIESDTPGGMGRPLPPELRQDEFDIEEKPGGDFLKQISKYAGPAGKIVEGIQQLKEEKKALQRAQQMQGVSDVVRQAANTRPEETKRRYVRPEDITNTGEEFFPIYGVGTNVLAKDGASVGGGEIMNTFAPNTLYDDLGYEPLNESERLKQFYYGGKMRTAQTGLEAFAQAGGGDMASQLITGITGENAGGNIGGTIGKTAGMFFGPVGSMVGQAAGQLIGSALDRKPQQIKKAKEATQRNIKATALQSGFQGGQAQYTSFMQDGGTTSPYEWVSHTWQPQVIATFGEHKVSQLLRPPKDADMLRAGGHLKEYTPPSARAMSTERPNFQMGGELQTHWGGYAEPMSQNPYLPGTGETVMFRGQSHDESDGKGNTGIGITYGGNPVEVERGEPMFELQEGGEIDPATGEPKKSGVVLGNIKITKAFADMLGDTKAEGMKFKTYGADLSKQENKQNKLIEKALDRIDNMNVETSIDKIAADTAMIDIYGGNAKLKDLADKKINAASLQNAINDTKEEGFLKITDRGDVRAEKGAKIPKAQTGEDVPKIDEKSYDYLKGLYESAKQEEGKKGGGPATLRFQQEYHKLAKPFAERIIASEPLTRFGKKKGYPVTDVRSNEDSIFGKRTKQYMAALDEAEKQKPVVPVEEGKPGPKVEPIKPVTEKTTEDTIDVEEDKTKRNYWMDIFNQVAPYLRPSDVEDLDPNQLAGEMYALATNQVQPVYAQTFTPQLTVPYDISLQDILNENRATTRAQQRLVGYNPALQSQLSAQEYSANQRVLGEQFRMNQAFKNQIYKENRDKLDQANLANLQILDTQAQRQAEALSKTKATTQAALNSIASKYAQNKLENRTLATYENLYNYRYDPRFRAINMNPLAQFNIPQLADYTPEELRAMALLREKESKTTKKSSEEKKRNGGIAKAFKNL